MRFNLITKLSQSTQQHTRYQPTFHVMKYPEPNLTPLTWISINKQALIYQHQYHFTKPVISYRRVSFYT